MDTSQRVIETEICIDASQPEATQSAVRSAYDGGASRVELCADMASHGLTPSAESIARARDSFGSRSGLLVMIRPRPGDFAYLDTELEKMHEQIAVASDNGADGVVLGLVRDGAIDPGNLESLSDTARALDLGVTFHRAFDALTDPLQSLEILIDLGVDRVLTSGCTWGSTGSAIDGVPNLIQYLERAGSRIEIVLGGGITPANTPTLLEALPRASAPFSVHAYSGVQQDGITKTEMVRALVRATR